MNSGMGVEWGWGWESGREVRAGRMRLLMRERSRKIGQCESLTERDEKIEKRPAVARCTSSPSFISANVFTISLWATMQKSFPWYAQVLHQSRKLPWAYRSFSTYIVRHRWCQELIQRITLADYETPEYIWPLYYFWKFKKGKRG